MPRRAPAGWPGRGRPSTNLPRQPGGEPVSTTAESGINLDLSAEQRAIQETVRHFVDQRVLPVAVENDIAHRLDMGIIAGMAELGILGAPVPPEYGGAGLDFVSEALICEEI